MPSTPTTAALLTLLLAGCDDANPRGEGDADGDGWTSDRGDCDDGDPTLHPGAPEIPADGIDQNCNGGDDCYVDADDDGWGSAERLASADLSCQDHGESTVPTDCDDDDPATYPATAEIPGDEKDQDCDGAEVCWQDLDGDGYGTGETIASADADCRDAEESRYATDCDDVEPAVNPGVGEVCNDHVDNDCDGTDGWCALDGEIPLGEADARIEGDEELPGSAGETIASGDVDGDGFDDVLVGAPNAGEDATGTAYLFYGPLSGTMGLSLAEATFVGDYELGNGHDVHVGDFDGDGRDDVQVDAPRRWGTPSTACLFYGPISGEMVLSTADARLLTEGGAFSVASGDVNGDGSEDILVGDWGTADAKSSTAHVVYGPVWGDIDVSMADASIEGEVASGWRPAAGDVDGDGVGDLILSAGTDVEPFSGVIYLLSGPTAGAMDVSSAEAELTGSPDMRFGSDFTADDMDRDGYDDVVAWSSAATSAYLFFGPVAGTHPASDADAVVDLGTGGSALATGDVDGDGPPDILIGAPGQKSYLRRSHVYLAYGPFSGTMEIDDPDVTFYLEGRYGEAGYAVTTGDVDGDGFADVLIADPSSPDDDISTRSPGAVYLFYGRGL